jgi:hypothetical protein
VAFGARLRDPRPRAGRSAGYDVDELPSEAAAVSMPLAAAAGKVLSLGEGFGATMWVLSDPASSPEEAADESLELAVLRPAGDHVLDDGAWRARAEEQLASLHWQVRRGPGARRGG